MSMAASLPRAAAPAVVAAVIPAAAPVPKSPGDIKLTVKSARSVNEGVPTLVRKGDPVPTYKWMINADDTGNPGTVSAPLTDQCLPSTAATPGVAVAPANTDLAATCAWPSIRTTSSHSDIIAQGTQDDLSAAKSLHLPGGKYLISVTATDFKIDGAHFTVDGGTPQTVAVEMQPTPLPLTTLKIQVFQDSAPVDATYEVDAEQGLAGFTAHLADVFGTVSVDYYGNALCTMYQHNGAGKLVFDSANKPVVDPTSIGRCVSDANGIITIPNMGPNRYASTVTPPVPVAGQGYQWVQTTSLEGGHDHDIWSQEGATGLDNEVTKGAEPVPMVQFGFVKTQVLPVTAGVTGEIKGRVNAQLPYIGGQNGQVGPEGLAGSKLGPVIKLPWLALSDLNRGDAQVYVGRGGVDGKFDIKNVPDSSYQLTVWDDDQDYILYSYTVEVSGGKLVDAGLVTLVGWFTHLQGTIFTDTNGNGVKDPGEAGVPNFTLTVRERDNSTMDQGLNTVTTDGNGHYDIREVYPLGKFLVLEAFNTRYQTTGVTYYGDNEATTPTTKLGGLVDFDFLAIIGLGGTVDWGVQPFAAGTNGGIAGTVTYDTTRNELDPADAVTESYQPGIPNIPVDLYQPVSCTPVSTSTCNKAGYEVDTTTGALVKGLLLNSYTTESWNAPKGCTAKLYNGKPLTDQQALPEQGAAANNTCVEAPMAGVAMGASNTTDPTSAGQTVNGNYGFTGSTRNLYPHGDARNTHDLDIGAPLPDGEEQDLPAADYIVSVGLPANPVPTASAPSMYKVTSEEDVNVFAGDSYLPQENFPPSAAQASNPAGAPDPVPTPPQPPSQQAGIISACVGAVHTVRVSPVENPTFVAGGGSPFEGQSRPSCQDKLVTVRSGQTTAPNFNLFTEVPVPTHFWGLTLNDLGITLDKRSANYGEALGMPYVPVGLYDWSGRLVDTVHTDFNGLYEALEPSTDTFNCPVPAGPCPNMYRFVGNDPGGIGSPNLDYNPRFRTIAATFQGWPGLYTVTDEAPTQVAATVLTPDTTVANNTVCELPGTTPQLFAVDKPVVRLNVNAAGRSVTINGTGFGSARGTLKLGTQTISGGTWSDTKITFTVPQGATAGARPISITSSTGQTAYNSLTLQVVSGASGAGSATTNPAIYEVGPGKSYASIQAAVNAAQAAAQPYKVVIVYPATPTALTPRGEYLENVLVNSALHIQGVGPGGFQGTTWVPGSIIDGSGFNPDNPSGMAWLTTLTGLRYTGAPAVPDAAVVTFLNPVTGARGSTTWSASLDGFQITGGGQADFAGNVNVLTGGIQTPYGAAGALITQGGGIYVHNGVKGLKLTDNLIVGNGGAYAGGIRVGTPYVGDNANYGISISRNQIRDNGGTNLAGGIGLFTGSNGYSVDHNAICGNHSSEYGGGISAFGFMGASQKVTATTASFSDASGGLMANNRIWFNQSYDEGGGVMVAGELPALTTDLSPGSGPVVIDANVIQANLANDDGGGVRLLQVSGKNVTTTNPGTISITNNTIANNVSAHEGGGIALDDAVFVNIVNDTITKNITTATAVTSNGAPAAAGLTTAAISAPLQARLNTVFAGTTGGTSDNSLLVQGTPSWLGFGRPTLLNDVFWDNRAGNYSGGYVYGIGGTLPNGAANSINLSDMEVVDQASGATAAAVLSPVNSVVQTTTGVATSSTNANADPLFVDPYDVTVSVLALRANPAFRQAAIVTTVLPFNLLGDYHLSGPSSSAYSRGAADYSNLAAPAPRSMWWGVPRTSATFKYPVLAATPDIDGQARPVRRGTGAAGLKYDAGSDQVVP
ncbi:MAG: SdrD B-like domain-containing protein [Terracoccus sp.]